MEPAPSALTSSEISSFARAALENSYDLSGLKQTDSTAIEAFFRKQLVERLEVNDPEIQDIRWKRFQVPGTTPSDYLERRLTLDARRSVLAGIRHMNLDRDAPFIDLWPDWTIRSEKELKEIERYVVPHFRNFSPRFLCVWLNPMNSMYQAVESRLVIGQHVLAATGQQIQAKAAPEGAEQIDFEAIETIDFFESYLKAYARFHAQHPELKNRVPVASLESMQASVREGLIYHATIDGIQGGLIAARREDFIGEPGVYFLEILINPPFKGRGLARRLQRAFMDRVSADNPNTVFWGTIDSQNLPSLRTALSVGRRIVSTECFIPVTE